MNEVRGLVRQGAQATAAVAGTLRDVHVGIAARYFDAAGTRVAGVRAFHERMVSLVYRSVGTGAAVVRELSVVADVLPPAHPLSRTQRGSHTLAVLNGLFGDRLATDRDLALPMSIVVDGRAIDVDANALATAFPRATERLVVFVHGLCESGQAWHRVSYDAGGEPILPYGHRLAADLDVTPVYVRYNTGLRIGANGDALDALLSQLIQAWPVPVVDLSIVGHSMGGLVARAACLRADAHASPWRGLLQHVVYLASPHQGAPLERFVERVTPTLGRLPETALIAFILDARSAGIRDLRFGTALSSDAGDTAPHRDDPPLPLPSDVRNHLVVATRSKNPAGLLSRLVGDGLVPVTSAIGPRADHMDLTAAANVLHVGRTNHNRILNHPDVYKQLVAWLA